jgi:predicted nucleotidyltransferase
MKRTASSTVARVVAYERRMKRRGMVKKHVWVPAVGADAILRFAADLRAGAGQAGKGDLLARAIAALRETRPLATLHGIRHAGVFGSVARGEAGPGSDLDILVEFERPAELDLFTYGRARRELAEALRAVLGRDADVVEIGSLRPEMRARVEKEAVFAY